jgi:tRNA nucleotidyltransferase/poly(A) polymerase
MRSAGRRAADPAAFARADPVLRELSARSAATGLELVLVGGAVRDLLLGRLPRDLDFALLGPEPACEAFLHDLAAGWGCRVLRFDRRGIRERRLPLPGRELDFVLAPAGGLPDELRRRDFTFNAMGIALPSGDLIDPLGGEQDLAAGLLRESHPGNLAEDPLRGLRAVRFLCEGTATAIEPRTAAAIRAAAGDLSRCAAERIRPELDRMAASPRLAPGLEQLAGLDLLAPLLPEALPLAGLAQNEFHHLDAWEHTVEAVRRADALAELTGELSGTEPPVEPPREEDLLVLKYAVLLHDLGKAATRSRGEDGRVHFYGHERVSAGLAATAMRRWMFPLRRADRIARLVLLHLRAGQLGKEAGEAAARRLVNEAGPDLELLLLLSLADGGAARGAEFAPRWTALGESCRRLHALFRRLGEELTRPQPLLSGEEIMTRLGIGPGPEVGRVLAGLLALQVAGEISTREEAIAALPRLASGPAAPEPPAG